MRQYDNIKILYRYRHNDMHAAVIECFDQKFTFIKGLVSRRRYDIHDGIGGVLHIEGVMSEALRKEISGILVEDEPSAYSSRVKRHNEITTNKAYMNDPLEW